MAIASLNKAFAGLMIAMFLLAATAMLSPAVAQEIHTFSVSPSDPASAIKTLAGQAGIHILASGDDLKGRQLNSVLGSISVDQALKDLLEGTGLTYRYVGARAVAVVAANQGLPTRSSEAAQSSASQPAPTESQSVAETQAAPPEPIEEVRVTGTRITTRGYESPTPLTSVDAGDLRAAAPVNISTYVNTLPQLSNSVTPGNSSSNITNGQAGMSILNLRNLGTTRTLVLVDGQRWVTSDVNGEVDINNIPQGLIKRVDIVTGGASATYGSDAVAGVVNFILDTNFTGLKGEVSGGKTTYGDDGNWTMSLTGGTGFADDRGHFLVEVDAANSDGILNTPRSWAQQGWKDINNPAYTPTNGLPRQIVVNQVGLSNAAPGGMIVGGPLNGVYFGPGGIPQQFNYGPLVSNPFVQGGDWRATDDDTAVTLDEALHREGLFGRASYKLTDNINVFAQYTYDTSRTNGYDTNEYSLGGITVSTSNPFLPASVAARANALGLSTLTLGTTYADLPRFGSLNRRTVDRYMLGGNGSFNAFGTPWTWDSYVALGISNVLQTANVTYNSNLANAQQAVLGPNGSIICASTLTSPGNGCVPFDLFGTGVNSQAAVNYVEGESRMHQTFEQTAGAIDLQGQPFSDWAGPVSLAFGVDGRRESVTGDSSPRDLAGDDFAGNYRPTFGHYEVFESYAEAAVPLAKSLSLSLAARATDYSISGYVTTWKIGAEYSPIPDIRFRATQSSDIRAPNLSDLFSQGALAVGSIIDPLIGNSNYLVRSGTTGNLALQPEKARTTTFGVVLQPSFLSGFQGSVDFYYIDIGDAIGAPGAQQQVYFCAQGITQYCNGIIRDGPVVDGVHEISSIQAQQYNEAQQTASGIDFDLAYHTPLQDLIPSLPGTISIRLLASNTLYDILRAGIPGVANVNSAGVNGSAIGATDIPHWQYTTTVTYNYERFNVALTGRGLSAGVYSNNFIQCTINCPPSTTNYTTIADNHVAGAWYLDGYFAYTFHSGDSSEAVAFLKVDNIFNKNPPISAFGPSGGTAFIRPDVNTSLYDAIGRMIRVGVRFSL